MPAKRLIKIALGLTVGLLCLGAVACGAILLWIQSSVEERCATAQASHPHPGDAVAALTDFMNSSAQPWAERDSAVWTLGRLSDPAALPALESAYTGPPCRHGEELCQYELEKAIRRCGGTPSPPRKTGVRTTPPEDESR